LVDRGARRKGPQVENHRGLLKEKLMRSVVLLFGLAALGTASVAPALAGPEIPAAAINRHANLLHKEKVTYLLRQLDLTEEQASHAEGLMESIILEQGAAPTIDLDKVRKLWTEIENYKAAGDQEKAEALIKELQQMGQDVAGGAEFFTNLEARLTDPQKQRLQQARARLERNPSGSIRPIDLLRAAWDLNPTEQQKRHLEEAHAALRKRIGPLLRFKDEFRVELVNFFADQLRSVLDPAQRAKFELRVSALRPDLIDQGVRVRLPENPPSETPPKPEDQPAEE
jgi:hypothetical protein